MVKVLQAFNFAKQYTYALNSEILAATLIDGKHVAICGAEQFIEIYEISGDEQLKNLDIPAEPGPNTPTKYSLATVGEVVNLIYCESGKYLLTLEKETICSPVHSNHVSSINCTSSGNSSNNKSIKDDTKMFVRIYANFWKFSHSKLIDLPITIRIASMTTPNAPLVESIDVIELPLRSSPDLMQCCQASGNIIVSSKERIYLFEYTQCVHENTQPRFSYIDFLPFKFFISLNFIPLKFSLTENVIACLNAQYCVAFKVVDVLNSTDSIAAAEYYADDVTENYHYNNNNNNSESSSIDGKANCARGFSGNSFELDSLESSTSARAAVAFPGRTPIDFNVARMINSVGGRDFEVELKSNSEDENDYYDNSSLMDDNSHNFLMAYPLRNSDIKIKLVNEAKAMNVQRLTHQEHDDEAVQYDIHRLLQIGLRRSNSTDINAHNNSIENFRCLDLRAIYQRNHNENGVVEQKPVYEAGNQQIPGAISSLKHANRRTLKSNKHQYCISYALLVASSVDGYLYQFCAQGKWYNENEKPIAVYAFTAPIIHVKLSDNWIYAITTESVETHTTRVGHKLFNNRFEYAMLSKLYPKEASPDVNAPVAMIGLASFMQVQHVCVNHNNLILISNSTPVLNGPQGLNKRLSSSNYNNCNNNNNNNSSNNGNGDANKRSITARLFAETRVKRLLRSSNSDSQQQQQQQNTNEWTLYNLELPSIKNVVKDLEDIADSYCADSININFFDLMEEAHVILRMSLSLQQTTSPAQHDDIFYEEQLRALFKENSRKLAEFSIRSNKREIYLQAIGFYKLCEQHLFDIYKRQVDLLQQEDALAKEQYSATERGKQLVGFIHTIKTMLMELGNDRQQASFLNYQVKPYFTPARVINHGYTHVPLSLELLNIFVRYSRVDIPQIMLHAPVVADAIGSELINYLRYIERLNADENLLLAVTACRMSNYLMAQQVISKTSQQDLGQALMRHKNVIFDDSTLIYQKQHKNLNNNHRITANTSSIGEGETEGDLDNSIDNYKCTELASFSEFTETILLGVERPELIEALCDVFIHALCIERTLSLKILMELFLNYIATHIGHKGYQSSQRILTITLQVYFYDIYDVMPAHHSVVQHQHQEQQQQQNELGYEQEQLSCTPPMPIESLDDYFDFEFNDGTTQAKTNTITKTSIENINSNNSNDIDAEIHSGSDTNSTGVTSSSHYERYANTKNAYDSLSYEDNKLKTTVAAAAAAAGGAGRIADEALTLISGNNDDTVQKGFKLLFRLYLGRLQSLTDLADELRSADVQQQQQQKITNNGDDGDDDDDYMQLRRESIKYLHIYLQEIREKNMKKNFNFLKYYYNYSNNNNNNYAIGASNFNNNNNDNNNKLNTKLINLPYIPDYDLMQDDFNRYIKTYQRPIPCLMERPQFLNLVPPFKRSDFSDSDTDNGEMSVRFLGWNNEFLTQTLKVQALLSHAKLTCDIVEEFLTFIQKTMRLIGIDSLLIILLPKHLAINYMLNFSPEHLWHYGRSHAFTPKHWENLVRKLINKKHLLTNWKEKTSAILYHLINAYSFEDLLKCYPSEVLQSKKVELLLEEVNDYRVSLNMNKLEIVCNQTNNGRILRNHLPMDNIDEKNLFEMSLRTAVAKQRSLALRTMIESTGNQLFDATNNPLYKL